MNIIKLTLIIQIMKVIFVTKLTKVINVRIA